MTLAEHAPAGTGDHPDGAGGRGRAVTATLATRMVLDLGQAALLGACRSASLLEGTCHHLADTLRASLEELLTGTQALPVSAAEVLIFQTAQRTLKGHQTPPLLRGKILAAVQFGLAALYDTAPLTTPAPPNRGQPRRTTRAQRRKRIR